METKSTYRRAQCMSDLTKPLFSLDEDGYATLVVPTSIEGFLKCWVLENEGGAGGNSPG